eukprot:g811.t1
MPLSRARKLEYMQRLTGFFQEFNKILVVNVDNVGSKQIQTVRAALRGRAELIFGKNTLMRKAIRDILEEQPEHPSEKLLPLLIGNMGFVFTNEDVGAIREEIAKNVVPAPAKAGGIAPSDVYAPAGPTGQGPDKTSFFQALNIATQIKRGMIEIVNPVQIIFEGEKVTNGAAELLKMLNIEPFEFGIGMTHVYDNGELFSVKVLDITDDVLQNRLLQAASTMASICLEIGFPTLASLPHSISNAFQKIASIALEVDYSFPKLEEIKSGAAAAAASAASAAPAGGDAPAEEEKEEEEKSVDMGGGNLFGDDDDDDY